jgi:hypothetical protein
MSRLLKSLGVRRQTHRSSTASVDVPESRIVNSADALFPVVGGCATLNRVHVKAYPSSHRGTKSCPNNHIAEKVKRTLGYARFQEGIDTVDMDVVVHFDSTDFDGESFGLALALADKRARSVLRPDQPQIVATGVLSHQGAILPVRGFAEKASVIATTCPSGAIFAFSRSHLSEHGPALEQLAMAGIKLQPADTLADLQELWQPQTPEVPPQGATRPWRLFLYGTGVGFLCVLGAVLFFALA